MRISDWSSDVCSSDLVEAPQALQVVAEEVEAQRLLLAWRETVDDAAAHRELAGLADGLAAVVAVLGEEAVAALGGPAIAPLTQADAALPSLRGRPPLTPGDPRGPTPLPAPRSLC